MAVFLFQIVNDIRVEYSNTKTFLCELINEFFVEEVFKITRLRITGEDIKMFIEQELFFDFIAVIDPNLHRSSTQKEYEE